MIFTAASDHTSPGVNHSLNISDIYGVPIIWGKRCNWTRHAPPLSLHTPSARGLDEALRLPRNPLALPPLCFPILPRALTHVHALSHLQPHADSNKSYTHKKTPTTHVQKQVLKKQTRHSRGQSDSRTTDDLVLDKSLHCNRFLVHVNLSHISIQFHDIQHP